MKFFFLIVLSVVSKVFPLEPVILLIGPPGSGKGTFAQKAQDKGFRYLSTGDLLRNEVKKQTLFGKQIAEIIKRGEFVDQKSLFALMKREIADFVQDSKPFIVDGYVRSQEDMDDFMELLKEFGVEENILVIKLETTNLTCLNRTAQRVLCQECSATLSIDQDKSPGAPCPLCHRGILQKRSSDTYVTVTNRLKTYRELDITYNKIFPSYPFLCFSTEDSMEHCEEIYEHLLHQLETFNGSSWEFVKSGNFRFAL